MIDRCCVCGADPSFTHVCSIPPPVVVTAPAPCSCGQVHHDFAPLGTFTPLPAAEFDRLLERGAESARELDALIAPMFMLGPEARLVLR